jgi:hypothetical protein
MNNRYGKSSVHVWPVCDSRATLASAVSLRFIQVILAVHNQPTNQSINQSLGIGSIIYIRMSNMIVFDNTVPTEPVPPYIKICEPSSVAVWPNRLGGRLGPNVVARDHSHVSIESSQVSQVWMHQVLGSLPSMHHAPYRDSRRTNH